MEAERAAEHGRGFAVVAQEVGSLAKMSGKAAFEISSIVKKSVASTQSLTSENKIRVEEGVSSVNEAAIILKDIEMNVNKLSEFSDQILSASKEQVLGIKQISTAMTQLDSVTQSNASTSEETASSSEQLAQALSMDSIVSELVNAVTGDGHSLDNSIEISENRRLEKVL